MEVRALSIPGAFELIPVVHGDDRGWFAEWYRADVLEQTVGHPLGLIQGNSSRSGRGVLRGVHFADVPPGQAKYVTCTTGSILDVIVDVRVGSATFGQSDAVRLDASRPRALYIAEGLGHAFLALEDDTTLTYLLSEAYAPEREHGINPLDPALQLPWPDDLDFTLSPRDVAAPSLADAAAAGLLPSYDACQAYGAELDARHASVG